MSVEEVIKVLGFSIGFLWGEAFRKTDYQVKHVAGWLQKQSKFTQWLVASLLDTQHHFQYGLALIILVEKIEAVIAVMPWLGFLGVIARQTPSLLLTWLAYGLIVSDWKDYEYVLKRMGLKT